MLPASTAAFLWTAGQDVLHHQAAAGLHWQDWNWIGPQQSQKHRCVCICCSNCGGYVQQPSAIPTSYMHRQQHSCSTGMPAISHAGSLSLSSKRRAKFQQHIQVCHTRPAEQQYILQLGHLLLLSRALRAPPASPGGGALCAAAVSTAALTLPAAPAAPAGGGTHHNSC
jgi:hypothetical protein